MNELGDFLHDINVVAFTVLAVACAFRWHRRGDASIRWATLAFGSLAFVAIVGLFLRTTPTTPLAIWLGKAILCVLVLFPLFLYRFATEFERPGRLVGMTAHAASALVLTATLLLPDLPTPGVPESGWWSVYRVAILVQWTILFSIVGVRLWVAARSEATVVRSRMRTLALSAAGMNGAILLSGVGASTHRETLAAVTPGLMLASALLFFVGLVPPASLIQIWRRRDHLAFQGAMSALFRAERQAELSAILLPHATGLIGGRGAALISPTGEVLGRHGPIDAELQAVQDGDLGAGPVRGTHRTELRAGSLVIWTSPYAPFFGPEEFLVTESLGVFADIVMDRCALADQQRQAEAALSYQATHDELTGLPNRVLLEERVTQALARFGTQNRVAVLFLDVDRFKVINDSLGHAVGDELLEALARRLEANLRQGDTIARFGGDEFVVVTEAWATDDAPTKLAARITESMGAPLSVSGTNVVAAVSIGVAVATPAHDAGALLRDADAAMYQAKKRGRNRWVLFDSAMREAATQRLETENALRTALDGGGLRVHYQPLVEIVSGRISGVEALVRWAKDEDTLILPRDFIPVAEETGLIIQLGATVLREACRQVAAWRSDIASLGHLSLAVNLSASELLNPGIVDQVRDALESCGLEPSVLCLEITESILLENTDSCALSLRSLQSLGVRIAVDDFGTGYSSLIYLKRLAVNTLKIDQAFVAGLGMEASQDRAIVAGVIDLAHAFGLTTVAEGVETSDQVTQLHALGCRLAQGRHFCMPLPPEDAVEWMREWEAPTGPKATAGVEEGRTPLGLLSRARWGPAPQRPETDVALQRTLGGGELRVHYQPLVEIVSGRISGVEAFVRWARDEDTLLLPRDFIPVAEEAGMIIQLGASVLREACRQVAVWRSEVHGLGQLSLSVKPSASELLEPGIVDQVRDALETFGLDSSVLCLEMAQSTLLDDTGSCARSLEALRALGVRVAVDDFGTARSSLASLTRLAVDTLKIDHAIVAGLGIEASPDRAIVAGIIDLANAYGLTTAADGVETREQLAELHALGCRLAQGRHFCMPLPPEDAVEWMRDWEAPTGPTAVVEPLERTRVLVVDDQGAMRNLLRLTLELEPQFDVIGEASDGREAVALARNHQPNLVLLDLAMPGIGGLEALPLIRAVAPWARIVILSGLDPVDVADLADGKGAVGYICKGQDPDRFLAELHGILASASAPLGLGASDCERARGLRAAGAEGLSSSSAAS